MNLKVRISARKLLKNFIFVQLRVGNLIKIKFFSDCRPAIGTLKLFWSFRRAKIATLDFFFSNCRPAIVKKCFFLTIADLLKYKNSTFSTLDYLQDRIPDRIHNGLVLDLLLLFPSLACCYRSSGLRQRRI